MHTDPWVRAQLYRYILCNWFDTDKEYFKHTQMSFYLYINFWDKLKIVSTIEMSMHPQQLIQNEYALQYKFGPWPGNKKD